MHKKEPMSIGNITYNDLHHVRSTPCSFLPLPPRDMPKDRPPIIPYPERAKELQAVIARARDELAQIRRQYEQDKRKASNRYEEEKRRGKDARYGDRKGKNRYEEDKIKAKKRGYDLRRS